MTWMQYESLWEVSLSLDDLHTLSHWAKLISNQLGFFHESLIISDRWLLQVAFHKAHIHEWSTVIWSDRFVKHFSGLTTGKVTTALWNKPWSSRVVWYIRGVFSKKFLWRLQKLMVKVLWDDADQWKVEDRSFPGASAAKLLAC